MAAQNLPPGWVRLSVGGQGFDTMSQTLQRSPFFAQLFLAGQNQTFFVDRDPEHFATILNYLRTGSLCVGVGYNLRALRLEADFYGLDDLIQVISETEKKHAKVETITLSIQTLPNADNRPNYQRATVSVSHGNYEHWFIRELECSEILGRLIQYNCDSPGVLTMKLKCSTVDAGSVLLNEANSLLVKRGYVLDAKLSDNQCMRWTFVKRGP